MDIWIDGVTLQPAPESSMETRQEVDLDLLEDEYLHIAPELYDAQGQLHGTTNIFDTAQVVLSVDMEAVQTKGGAFRQWSYEIPTNLLYTREEPFVQIRLENGEQKAEQRNYWRSDVASAVVWSQKQEMLYATIKTNEDCAGSIGLYCLGPGAEESFTDESEPRRVRKEPIATLTEIPVSESRWVLGLADVEEGLLLFIGEPDGVTTELYGYDGTLLDSQKTPAAQPVHEIQVLQTDWEQGRGIYVRGSEQIDTDSYFVHFFRGYWVENGTITPVYAPEDGQGDVIWAAVGKDQVLIVQKNWDTWGGKSTLVKDNTVNGWALWIYDTAKDPAGRMVYHGELETDLNEDALNILNTYKTSGSRQRVQPRTLREADVPYRYLMIEDISGKGGDKVWGRNEWYYY